MSLTTKIAKPGSLEIVYRKLASLAPYERNARTHSASQISKLKASLQRYGWTNSILIAGDDILAGHARHQAATEMARDGIAVRNNADPLSAPTVDLSHLSEQERRAYIVADNKLAEEAGWNMNLLRLEFVDLSLQGFDLAATGFDLKQQAAVLSANDDGAKADRVLSDAQEDQLDVAWQLAISEWKRVLETADTRGWISPAFTKGALAVQFLRSLFHGDDIPRGATLAYTPHRAATIGDQGAMIDAFDAALSSDGRSIRNSLRWLSGEKPSFDRIIGATTLPVHGRRIPGDFPALLARDLIDEFCPDRGVVLDPCHGWGGRMLGFLLSHAYRYIGFDPSEPTSHGVSAMFEDLRALGSLDKLADLRCAPFEDGKLKASSVDFALTSPPYFDTEKYAGSASSWRMYPTFEDWSQGFYRPLLEKTSRALRKNAVFALQVGSQSYPLKERAIALGGSVGFDHVETRHTIMVNNHMETAPDQGEVIVVLRKR